MNFYKLGLATLGPWVARSGFPWPGRPSVASPRLGVARFGHLKAKGGKARGGSPWLQVTWRPLALGPGCGCPMSIVTVVRQPLYFLSWRTILSLFSPVLIFPSPGNIKNILYFLVKNSLWFITKPTIIVLPLYLIFYLASILSPPNTRI